ncbi:MAG: hypothetical protein RLO81_06355, partial [Fulvivirga sp.]|uniref:hypothetical protein n=1 Tax=Fulvivirga sp. TaxID=1931237 RepID=UPI0032ED1277
TNRPYIIVLSISLILAVPISQIMVDGYLDTVNAFHAPVGFKMIIPSIAIIVLAIFSTISLNLVKVAKSRPTDNLKER